MIYLLYVFVWSNTETNTEVNLFSKSVYLTNRVAPFFSEMAILWGLLRYTTKGQKFWSYGLFKAARPKRKKILKIKYGSKCLELFNSARNAKIAKQIQKASIWPLKASKLNFHARFYLTKLVSKYIHNRIFPSEKWFHPNK